MRVEIEREVDVTDVLDGWTIEEVREFAAYQDHEGRNILSHEGKVESEDQIIDLRSSAISVYLAEREAREAGAPALPTPEGAA